MEEAALFRRVAKRCRELALRTDIEAVKEQLRIWAEEFEDRSRGVEELAAGMSVVDASVREVAAMSSD